MLRCPKFLQTPTKLNPRIQQKHTSRSSLPTHQCCNVSRRNLAIGSNSLLFLSGLDWLNPSTFSRAIAEETAEEGELNDEPQETGNLNSGGANDEPQETGDSNSGESNVEPQETVDPNSGESNEELQKAGNSNSDATCGNKTITGRSFLDVSIDGNPVGRIVVGLYGNDAPLGAERFGSLASGRAGISYRRKEFVKIMPNYVQHGGVRSYSGDSVDSLVKEWERVSESCPGIIKNVAGTVSIVVRDPLKPPPKLKLMAKQGKLEIAEEEVGSGPNGTEFVISVKDSPELDTSALVVGRVLEGMDVVERIAQVKAVRENSTSPYFRVAKLIGDKRAVVAERGFNRPYSKIIVTNCGSILE